MTTTIKVNSAVDGQPYFGVSIGGTVTLLDVTPGAFPATREWAVVSYPGPLSSAPALSSTTTASATFTAASDGMYIVRLRRKDGGVWSSALSVVGVPNAAGLIIPAPYMSGLLLANFGATQPEKDAAVRAGYAGGAEGHTNFLLEAVLRYLFANIGAGAGSSPTSADKHLTGLNTTADGSLACATGLTLAPVGHVTVTVNGLWYFPGAKTTLCYWSSDFGATALSQGSITQGAKLYWNHTKDSLGLQIATTDEINFVYNA